VLDDHGEIVHAWFHPDGIQHLKLLENGNLLVHTLPPEDAGGAELIGGSAGSLIELDWDSQVVWEYQDRFLHHDYQRLANGNSLIPGYYFVTLVDSRGVPSVSKIIQITQPTDNVYLGVAEAWARETNGNSKITFNVTLSNTSATPVSSLRTPASSLTQSR